MKMNSLKLKIESSFEPFGFSRGADELFSRYKRRKKRLRAALTSTAAVFAVFFAVIFSTGIAGNPTGIKALALSVGDSKPITGENALVTSSPGVQKQIRSVVYDADGRELVGRSSGAQSGRRTVVMPSPICLSLTGDNVKNYTVSCTSNGFVYAQSGEGLKNKKLSFKSYGKINWIPSCERFTAALGGDLGKIPSTLTADRRAGEKIESLLKTAADYTRYFGDTITITAECSDGSTERVRAVITLDKNGRYYISTER
jgi:hypothetical protein